MARVLFMIVLTALHAALCSGCSTSQPVASVSHWQQHYVPPRIGAVNYPPRQAVQVRVVEVQQFKDGGTATKRYFDDRRLAPEDMTAADATEVRRMMLESLRVHEDPTTTAVLGSSSFTTPYQVRLDDKDLVNFAKGIGADFVVVGTEFAGERQGMGMAPVLSTSSGQASASARGSGGWASGNAWGSGSSVTWVPVPNTYQQWGTLAMFFRKLTPEERAVVDARYSSRK